MKRLIPLIVLLMFVLPVAAHIGGSLAVTVTDSKGREFQLTHRGFTPQQWGHFDMRVEAALFWNPNKNVQTLVTRGGDGDMKFTLNATPLGATDSDEECADETATMCDEAGHGPGSQNVTRTQHAEQDGGGCTCSADCGDDSGTQAFVTSNDPCG